MRPLYIIYLWSSYIVFYVLLNQIPTASDVLLFIIPWEISKVLFSILSSVGFVQYIKTIKMDKILDTLSSLEEKGNKEESELLFNELLELRLQILNLKDEILNEVRKNYDLQEELNSIRKNEVT